MQKRLTTILIATTNTHKFDEISSFFDGSSLQFRSLTEIKDYPCVVEDGSSFEENALKKAIVLMERTGLPVIADDSGLEVDFLNGAPGIFSARYGGEEGNSDKNIAKLLTELAECPLEQRTAQFRCVIALALPDKRRFTFEGMVKGIILKTKAGENGFGYDPVFYYPPLKITFAEMEPRVKNSLSHRANALAQLKNFISSHLKY